MEPENPPSDSDLEALTQLENKGPVSTAEDMLDESLVPAVQSIIDTAINGENEGNKIKCAFYIVDRKLGKATAGKMPSDWERLFGEIEDDVKQKRGEK